MTPITEEQLRKIAERVQVAINEFERDGDEEHERGGRPDLWDSVIEVRIDDACALLAVMTRERAALARAERAIELEAEVARLKEALASDARVDAILVAVLMPGTDPSHGTRDHMPRSLREYLGAECARSFKLGWDDGYAEGHGKAEASARVSPEWSNKFGFHEAEQEVADAVSALKDRVRQLDAEIATLRRQLDEARADGWMPIEDTTPLDVEYLLGWWEQWPALKWRTKVGPVGSKRGGWLDGHAKFYRKLPEPPLPPAPSEGGATP